MLQEGAVPDPSRHGDDHVIQGVVPDPSDREADHVIQEGEAVPDPNSHGNAHVTQEGADHAPNDPVSQEAAAPPSENVPEWEEEEGAHADHVIQWGVPTTPQGVEEVVVAGRGSTDHGSPPSARMVVPVPTSRAEEGGPYLPSPQLLVVVVVVVVVV